MNILDHWLSSTLQDFEWLLRIFISSLLGFFIGLNRTHKQKPAGVKTYMYVTTASTLITIVSIQSVLSYAGVKEQTMMDPMRLAAQIVTGLGFIGAGVILKDRARVIGLTSAAMIFYAGGIGIAIGAGFYTFVLFSYMVTSLFVLFGERIEKRQNKTIKTPRLDLLEKSE